MRKFSRTMKGTIILAIILFAIMSIATPIFARVAQEAIVVNFNNINIAVNGQRVNTEFEPFIFQGRTYLPTRDVASAMGFNVTWEDTTNIVHLTSQANVEQQSASAIGRVAQETIVVNFNNIRIAVNGTIINTEYEPFIFQGRTFLPVRDVANATGFDVTWDDTTSTVHLTSHLAVTPNYPPHHQPPVPNYPPHQQIQPQQPPTQIITPPPTQINPPIQNNNQGQSQGNRPSNPAISLERAIQIGYEELARRGHTGTFRNHSGMDWEPRYGGWVWEIVFRVPGGRLPLVEMYINVHTGAVAKFEWDD